MAAASCTQSEAIKETAPDTYFLSESFSRGLYDSAHDKAVSRAGDYCLKTDRRVLIDYVLQGPTNEHGAGSAVVSFRCLHRGDPELQHAK
jgi:hypothetical protein